MGQRGLKHVVMLGAAIGLIAGAAGHAETPSPGANASACPRGPVSIYFSTGDVTPSPQTQAVLSKIRETAGECAADRFEIVAHVDAAEGEHALALALERLKRVADQLVSLGLPAAQIRLATDPPDTDRSADIGHRQMDIQFWKREETPERKDAGADRRRVTTAPRPNEI
jgi:hypothetical protein